MYAPSSRFQGPGRVRVHATPVVRLLSARHLVGPTVPPSRANVRSVVDAPWSTLAAVLGLGLVGVLAYWNSFHGALVRDGQLLVSDDPRVHELSWLNLRLIFEKSYWWPHSATNAYRPATTLSYLVNWTLFGSGGRPEGYHVVNLLLHWTNASLLFLLARRRLAHVGSAWVAAALFTVHPVQTEAVTYTAGRADELVACAVLAGLMCHLRASEASGARRWLWLGLLAFAAWVGAFSKETGILLVAALALHDWVFVSPPLVGSMRERLTAMRKQMAGYIAVLPAAAALLVARYYVVVRGSPLYGESFVENPISHSGRVQGFLTAVGVQARLLGLLVFPRHLSSDYSYNQVPLYGGAASWRENALCWIGLATVLILLLLAARRVRTSPSFAFGTFFFFGMQLPTANILFPIGSIMAERFLYLPSFGFCLAVAPALLRLGSGLAARLPQAARTLATLAPPALALSALGARTWIRNIDWQDGVSLWRSTVDASPDSVKARAGLAAALLERGATEANIDAAIASAEQGLAILDTRPLSPDRRGNQLDGELGRLYRLKGELLRARGADDEAWRFFERSWSVLTRAREVDAWVDQASRQARIQHGASPKDVPDVGNHELYLDLFRVGADLQRWPEATEAAAYARTLAPLDPNTHLAMARAHLASGDFDEAAVSVIESLVVDSGDAEAWTEIQNIYGALGVDNAVFDGSRGRGFNTGLPKVRDHVTRACVELIRLLLQAKNVESARIVYDRAMDPGGLNCRAEALGPRP